MNQLPGGQRSYSMILVGMLLIFSIRAELASAQQILSPFVFTGNYGPNEVGIKPGQIEARHTDHEDERLENRSDTFVIFQPIGNASVEAGQVVVNHGWQTVELQATFRDPIVIAKPASHNGGDPGVIRLQNVTPESFQIRFQEWDYLDGQHDLPETVTYVVLERGRSQLADGQVIEAGSYAFPQSHPEAPPFMPVTFSEPFATTPLVLTAVGTFRGGEAVTTRNRNVTPTGFEVTLQEQEANPGDHLAETVYWMAWPAGEGFIGDQLVYEAGLHAEVTHNQTPITFATSFVEPPCFVADMQTANGPEPANLRYSQLSETGIELVADEEQSLDEETFHLAETVGAVALDCGTAIIPHEGGRLGLKLPLYDDFSDPVLDPNKWSPRQTPVNGATITENSLGVIDGVLESTLTIPGQETASSFLYFTNPLDITAYYADITVADYFETEPNLRARLGGYFYNDGVEPGEPGDSTSDIFAQIWIKGDMVEYVVIRCLSSDCQRSRSLGDGPTEMGKVILGSTHGLYIGWDGKSTFTFQLDDQPPVTFDAGAAGAPFAGPAQTGSLAKRQMGIRANSASGTMTATFDNVRAGRQVRDERFGGHFVSVLGNREEVKTAILNLSTGNERTGELRDADGVILTFTGQLDGTDSIAGRLSNETCPGDFSGTLSRRDNDNLFITIEGADCHGDRFTGTADLFRVTEAPDLTGEFMGSYKSLVYSVAGNLAVTLEQNEKIINGNGHVTGSDCIIEGAVEGMVNDGFLVLGLFQDQQDVAKYTSVVVKESNQIMGTYEITGGTCAAGDQGRFELTRK